MTIRKLLDYKTNLVGTAIISVLASASTLALSKAMDQVVVQPVTIQPAPITATGVQITACENGLYSPVQRRCVSKQVFDVEMKRLFSALGIDTSVYELGRNNE